MILQDANNPPKIQLNLTCDDYLSNDKIMCSTATVQQVKEVELQNLTDLQKNQENKWVHYSA